MLQRKFCHYSANIYQNLSLTIFLYRNHANQKVTVSKVTKGLISFKNCTFLARHEPICLRTQTPMSHMY